MLLSNIGTFPFGQPIRRVTQLDRGPKRVFILGVYASAVHARWCGADGKQLVRALAVASEPLIFWPNRGGRTEVEDILSAIDVPGRAGRLEPAAANLNGPSGRSIDEGYLGPLGLARADAWLCDLVPHSCMNKGQANAIDRAYNPLVDSIGLPPVQWPPVPRRWTDTDRRDRIAAELQESAAEVLVTLGDQPLKWFARFFGSKSSLRAYGEDSSSYGRLHDIKVNGRAMKLLPLVHARQAAGLSGHSPKWHALHKHWAAQVSTC